MTNKFHRAISLSTNLYERIIYTSTEDKFVNSPGVIVKFADALRVPLDVSVIKPVISFRRSITILQM